jgi:hypothetical protein
VPAAAAQCTPAQSTEYTSASVAGEKPEGVHHQLLPSLLQC